MSREITVSRRAGESFSMAIGTLDREVMRSGAQLSRPAYPGETASHCPGYPAHPSPSANGNGMLRF